MIDEWPFKRERCCDEDMGGSHYHCGNCGKTSSMLGHYVCGEFTCESVGVPGCGCRACLTVRHGDHPEPWRTPLGTMILCPECGNKRCPQATDHNFACTASNEPNQPGSCYNWSPS